MMRNFGCLSLFFAIVFFSTSCGTTPAKPSPSESIVIGKSTELWLGKELGSSLCGKNNKPGLAITLESLANNILIGRADLHYGGLVTKGTFSAETKDQKTFNGSLKLSFEDAYFEFDIEIFKISTNELYVSLKETVESDCDNGTTSTLVIQGTLNQSSTLQGFSFDDMAEPNPRAEFATPIEMNSSGEFVSFNGDVDWYSFEIKEAMKIEVAISSPAKGFYGEFSLYDAQLEPTGWFTLIPGKYYLKLSGSYSIASGSLYTLALTGKALPDNDIEPNEAKDTASQLGLSTVRNGFISPNDQDWYKFTLDQPSLFLFSTKTFLDSGEIGCTLKDQSGNELQMERDIEQAVAYLDLEAGSYYLVVSTGFDELPYTLDVSAIPFTDASFEPNNNVTTATPIVLSGEIKTLYLSKGDTDVFTFNIDKPTIVEIDVKSLGPSINWWFDDGVNFVQYFNASKYRIAFVPGKHSITIENDLYDDHLYESYGFPYSLTVSHYQFLEPDALELGNGQDLAIPLEFGKTYENLNVYPGDSDVFKFAISEADLAGNGFVEVYVDFQAYNTNLYQAINWWIGCDYANSGCTAWNYAIIKPGTYYIIVAPEIGGYGDYSLTVHRE